ncbi:MAG TPA: hypothetical protein VJC16_02670 [Candidatus Nanoarchaeia archaeon]|nr:hypothetical protein [Candidatus Nanoarchaeia archaeon]
MRIYGILVILAVLLAACQSVPPAEQAMAEKEVAADAGAAAVEEAVAEDVVIEDQAEGAMIEKSGSAIAIQDRTVSPAELSVAAGTEVAISVSGPTTHIIVITDDVAYTTVANLGPVSDGNAVTYTFAAPGKYTVKSLKVGNVRTTVTVQ